MTRFLALLAQRVRRDAMQATVWIAGIVALAALAYVGVDQEFGTADDRAALVSTAIANPVIMLFRGLPSGTDQGALIAFLIVPYLVLLAAFMNTFLAVRHTRGDEEVDRTELVAATPAGRTLPLVATVVHAVLLDLVLAALLAAAFVAVGQDLAGAVTIGAATAAAALAFFGIALVAAQFVRTSRAANSVAVWAVLGGFVIAGVGNALGTPDDSLQRIESSWPTWVSPFGWAENTRPFDTNDPHPLLAAAALAVVAVAAAFALQAARDIGDAFVPERRGAARASALLSRPTALAWRLSRGAIAGWVVGGLLTGILSTRLADVISEIGDQVPAVQQIVAALASEGSLAQGAITIFFVMGGVLAGCAAVQTISRARQEEARGTAEAVLAASVGRVRWLTGYLIVAFAGIVLTLAAAVAGAAVGLAAAVALVFAIAPRVTVAVGWTFVAAATVIGLFGQLFGFPDALVNLSPVAAAPSVDGDGVDIRGLWWLVSATVAGSAAALWFMSRRELASDG